MDVTALQNDSEFRTLAEEAKTKNNWAIAYNGLTAFFGLATVALAAMALPFVGAPAFLGGAANLGLAAAGMAASTVAVHLSTNNARDDAQSAKERLTNYIEKRVEGKTDKDLDERLSNIETALVAVAEGHEREASGGWVERTGSNRREASKPWREFIAEQTLDLEQQR